MDFLPNIRKLIFTGLTLIFLLPTAVLSREVSVLAIQADECVLGVEADDEQHTLRLRARHPEFKNCNVSENDMISALASSFAKTDPPTLRGEYTSLFIGRLIDYPWFSHYLANAAYRDADWNRKKGKPRTGNNNGFVARKLFGRTLPMQTELARHGYRIIGVSVEKVLVGGFHSLPFYRGKIVAGRIPYDAQVWFRLQKAETPSLSAPALAQSNTDMF